jgi:hypothetical protein
MVAKPRQAISAARDAIQALELTHTRAQCHVRGSRTLLQGADC